MTTKQKPNRDYPLKVEAAYGRIYVHGQMAKAIAEHLAGAHHDLEKDVWHLSLTLETLRALKRAGGFTSDQLMRYCTPALLAWAQAAHKSEKRVNELHARIDAGYRVELPWVDNRAHTVAPVPVNDKERAQRYEAADSPTGWRWKYRDPFAHQTVMATAACSLDGCAFLCEMGTAKTRPALETAGYHFRNSTIDMLLVVAPANVLDTWRKQTLEWSNLKPVVLEGTVRERERQLVALAQARVPNTVAVVNYEVLARMKPTIIRVANMLRLGFLPDEMHKLRNPSAKQTKAAMEIAAHCGWRLGMTGSPILNGIENIWSQWYVIDLGVAFGANFVQFKREFFSENPYAHSISPLDNTASTVGLRIRKRGLRYRKADCLDLPPKLFEVKQCEMTPEQKRAYDEMAAFLLVQLRDMETDETRVSSASIHLTMMLRLSQITSGFLPIEPEAEDDVPVAHIFDPNPKLILLDEIAQELRAQNQQFIVWARYKHDIETIAELLSQYGPVAKYYSKTSRQDKILAEQKFQDGRVPMLVGHPASGGLGLTLTAASTHLYYSQDYNLEYRIQSEDRSHRPGAEIHSAITYIDLQCRNTVDEIIRASLGAKLATAEAVTELRKHLEAIAA